MTNAKLFARLRTLIEDANNTDKKHIKKLRKVLHKLKERQHQLRDVLAEVEDPPNKMRIEQEIEVIVLQRRKGAEVYKQLKQARKARKKEDSGRQPRSGAPDAAGPDS
jgi:hypothetical protein